MVSCLLTLRNYSVFSTVQPLRCWRDVCKRDAVLKTTKWCRRAAEWLPRDDLELSAVAELLPAAPDEAAESPDDAALWLLERLPRSFCLRAVIRVLPPHAVTDALRNRDARALTVAMEQTSFASVTHLAAQSRVLDHVAVAAFMAGQAARPILAYTSADTGTRCAYDFDVDPVLALYCAAELCASAKAYEVLIPPKGLEAYMLLCLAESNPKTRLRAVLAAACNWRNALLSWRPGAATLPDRSAEALKSLLKGT